jgi:hypothetical protein
MVDASELETAPAMRERIAARAVMKWLTVEPVPTPTTIPSFRKSSAACATRFLRSSGFMRAECAI